MNVSSNEKIAEINEYRNNLEKTLEDKKIKIENDANSFINKIPELKIKVVKNQEEINLKQQRLRIVAQKKPNLSLCSKICRS